MYTHCSETVSCLHVGNIQVHNVSKYLKNSSVKIKQILVNFVTENLEELSQQTALHQYYYYYQTELFYNNQDVVAAVTERQCSKQHQSLVKFSCATVNKMTMQFYLLLSAINTQQTACIQQGNGTWHTLPRHPCHERLVLPWHPRTGCNEGHAVGVLDTHTHTAVRLPPQHHITHFTVSALKQHSC